MSHAAGDLRALDCQSNPFLLALQNASSRQGRHLSALYQRVALEGGLVLLPPPALCPPKGKFEEKWAKAHVLLPVPVVASKSSAAAAAAAVQPVGSVESSGGDESVLGRSASGSTADSSGATESSPLSAPLSSWLRPDATSLLSAVVHISGGCIYIGMEGESASQAVARTEPRARILLEELHYDDEFRSFRVLAIDQPLCGPKGETIESAPAAGAAAAATAAGGKKAGTRRGASSDAAASSQNHLLPSHSAGNPVAPISATSPHAALHRPELRSLSLQRDVLTGVLGADVSTRAIFASPRLDFFFTDFSLAWLGTVANAGEKAAEHLRLACNRTLKEAVAMIKASGTSGGGGKDSAALSAAAAASLSAAALGAFPLSDTQPATAKSLANWSAARYAELEIAIQSHVHSCLHGKIFTATLARMPLHRLAGEQLAKSMQAIDAATSASGGCTLSDIGLSPELVSRVDPRPAVEQMKALNSFVTPLERLACLARVEALLLESINVTPKNHAPASAATAAGNAAASDKPQQLRPQLHRGATLPASSSIPEHLSSATAASSRSSASSAMPVTARSRSNSAASVSASAAAAAAQSAEGETVPAASSLTALNASSVDGSSAGSATGGSSVLVSPQTGSPLSSSLAVAAASPSASAASDGPSPLSATAAATTTIPPPALNPALVKSASVAPSSSSRGSHHKSSSSVSQQQQLSVSADDLLPLLVFVLLEARPAHLHANVCYMRLFAPSAELLTPSVHSELLYRLANLEAAVSYIESGRLLQHIRESQASRPATATAAGVAPSAKKPRSRMSSISLQSTKTLLLLLTPAPNANGSGGANGSSSGTSSRRNLFRRDSAETAAAEGGETPSDAAAAAARIASPLTGSSAGASRALSPADGASSLGGGAAEEEAEDDEAFLEDDVEGIDEEDDDACFLLPLDSQLHTLHLQQQHQLLMQSAADGDAEEDEQADARSGADDLFSVAASKLRRSHLNSELSSNGLGSSSSHAFVPSFSSAGSSASSSVAAGGGELASPSASAVLLPQPSAPVTNAASALFGESLPDPEPLLLEGASTLPAWLLNEDSSPAHAKARDATNTSAAAAGPSAEEPCIDDSDPVSRALLSDASGLASGCAQSMAAPLTRRRSTAVVSSTLPPSLSFSSVLGSPPGGSVPPRVKSPAVFAPYLPRAMSMQNTGSSSSGNAAGTPAPAASPALESSPSSSSAGAVSLRQTTVAAEEDPLGALMKSKKKPAAAATEHA